LKQAILDTDTLSYVIDGRYPEVTAQAKQYLRVFHYFSISVVSVCEIIEGREAIQDYAGIADFLKRVATFEIFSIDTDEAITAGEILGALSRTGQKIGDLDPFIAAVAIVNQLPLITNNQRHYQRIIDLGFALTLDNWKQS